MSGDIPPEFVDAMNKMLLAAFDQREREGNGLVATLETAEAAIEAIQTGEVDALRAAENVLEIKLALRVMLVALSKIGQELALRGMRKE